MGLTFSSFVWSPGHYNCVFPVVWRDMKYVIKVNGIVLVSNGKSIPFCACKLSPLEKIKFVLQELAPAEPLLMLLVIPLMCNVCACSTKHILTVLWEAAASWWILFSVCEVPQVTFNECPSRPGLCLQSCHCHTLVALGKSPLLCNKEKPDCLCKSAVRSTEDIIIWELGNYDSSRSLRWTSHWGVLRIGQLGVNTKF